MAKIKYKHILMYLTVAGLYFWTRLFYIATDNNVQVSGQPNLGHLLSLTATLSLGCLISYRMTADYKSIFNPQEDQKLLKYTTAEIAMWGIFYFPVFLTLMLSDKDMGELVVASCVGFVAFSGSRAFKRANASYN